MYALCQQVSICPTLFSIFHLAGYLSIYKMQDKMCMPHGYTHENWLSWNNTNQTRKIVVFNSNPYVFWQSWKLQIRRDSCPLSTLNMWSVHKVKAAYLCFIIMHNLLKNVICISLICNICVIEYIKYDFLPNVQCEHVFHFCNLLYNLFFSI